MEVPMTVLEKISFYQNRRDEVPNQELARQLSKTGDKEGIQEIAANLWNKNQNVRSDCLKVLYEIGYIKPELVAGYVQEFLKLLEDRNNRMVWGAMIGLGTTAALRPGEVWEQVDTVISAVEQGSVISVVWGIKVLSQVAAADPVYNEKLFPLLLARLQQCHPRDVPTFAEHVLVAVNPANQEDFLIVLKSRMRDLRPTQNVRLKKVIKSLEAS
jgi:hypothetical protein